MKPEVALVSITLQDNSIAIMQFVVDDHNGLKQKPTAENIDATIVKSKLRMKSWRIVDEADIPRDRSERNAWRDDGKRIYVHR